MGGYKCDEITDMGITGKGCIRDCRYGMGGPNCEEECNPGGAACSNGLRTSQDRLPTGKSGKSGESEGYNPGQSTHCDDNYFLNRGAWALHALDKNSGVLVGYCESKNNLQACD